MNLQTLSSHTIDVDRLPEAPYALDVGCRNFDFTRDLLAQRGASAVVALDPAPDVLPFKHPGVWFLNMALVGDERNGSGFVHFSDGMGDFLCEEAPWWEHQMFRVPCINMRRLMAARAIDHWDVVKLDCEGTEFQILENWPGPIATQISVEFHDWDRRDKYPESYYHRLFAQLGQFGYRVVKHELSVQGTGCGHWDSLLVLEA